MSKIAFVYPGQGTQYVGMGKELYDKNEKARELFDKIFNSLDLICSFWWSGLFISRRCS